MSKKLVAYFSASGVTAMAAKMLANTAAGIEQYDVVFVGFPVWWYTAPTIIKTFLESYDFVGKVVVPFATPGGSGLGETSWTLQEVVPGASVKEGRMLNGKLNAAELKQWADKL